MSLTESRTRYPVHNLRRSMRTAEARPAPPPVPRLPHELQPRAHDAEIPAPKLGAPSPIVPVHSMAGHSLLAVIAIMSFLAAATLGAVVLVRTAATEWQGQVSRELTIQVRPMPGRDIEAEVARAAELARATGGVAEVK